MTDAWTFREGVNKEHVFDLLQCVVEIVDALNELKDVDEDSAGLQAILSARRTSIQLRKLLLDGNRSLIQELLYRSLFPSAQAPFSAR